MSGAGLRSGGASGTNILNVATDVITLHFSKPAANINRTRYRPARGSICATDRDLAIARRWRLFWLGPDELLPGHSWG